MRLSVLKPVENIKPQQNYSGRALCRIVNLFFDYAYLRVVAYRNSMLIHFFHYMALKKISNGLIAVIWSAHLRIAVLNAESADIVTKNNNKNVLKIA